MKNKLLILGFLCVFVALLVSCDKSPPTIPTTTTTTTIPTTTTTTTIPTTTTTTTIPTTTTTMLTTTTTTTLPPGYAEVILDEITFFTPTDTWPGFYPRAKGYLKNVGTDYANWVKITIVAYSDATKTTIMDTATTWPKDELGSRLLYMVPGQRAYFEAIFFGLYNVSHTQIVGWDYTVSMSE